MRRSSNDSPSLIHGARVNAPSRKPRVAVVSPFLDNGYGTERIVIRWITALADDFDIHIYSQRVQDVDLSKFTLHKIPTLPGPHIFNFVWWYFANQVARAWDRTFRDLRPDIVFSPGVNCPDADVISVHIVFAEFARQAAPELQFSRAPLKAWPRLLHRRLYYRLIIFLESRVYRQAQNYLVLIANKTAKDLAHFYNRTQRCLVLYLGLDHNVFNPEYRAANREAARAEFGYRDEDFVVVLVGNDLRKKGIRALIEAMQRLRDSRVRLLIATRDDVAPFEEQLRSAGVMDRIQFRPPRSDVAYYYAAGDAYAGPSLEDTFALPPVEAMACGVPALVSRENGTVEIIEHGVNGMILEDPTDSETLARMLLEMANDPAFAARLAQRGAETARQFTWERNVDDVRGIFAQVLARNDRGSAEVATSEAGAGTRAASK
jgi:glycosyltransferase involved in cell wall biosynthesis